MIQTNVLDPFFPIKVQQKFAFLFFFFLKEKYKNFIKDSSSFSEKNLIGFRYSPIIVKSSNETFLIGGSNSSIFFFNEIWSFSYFSNETHKIFFTKPCLIPPSYYANYYSSVSFNSLNIFGGRSNFGAVIKSDSTFPFILLFYGLGFTDSNVNTYLGDVWIIRISDFQSKYIFKTTDTYSTTGTKYSFSNSNIISIRGKFAYSQINSSLISLHGGFIYGSGEMWLIKYSDFNGSFQPAFVGGTTTGSCYSTPVNGSSIYSSSYFPACRNSHSSFFDSKSNKVFIFGGISSGISLQDLWAFKLESYEFAWINGVNPIESIYAIPNSNFKSGYFNSSNLPSSRYFFSSFFDEKNRIFVVFGGNNGATLLNDVWIFSPSLLQWKTFSSNSINENQGSLGIYSSENNPPTQYGGSIFEISEGILAAFYYSSIYLIGISNCNNYNILNNSVCSKNGICGYNDDFQCKCSFSDNLHHYFESDSDCTKCLNHFDIKTNCSKCDNENFDFSSKCSSCLNKFDIQTNCSSCINENFDLKSNCSSCKNNFDILNDCLSCQKNYFGDSCDVTTCNGVNSNDSLVCSSHGNCSTFDNCKCNSDFNGFEYVFCSLVSCFDILGNISTVCKGHGKCLSKNYCSCDLGWTGTEDCSTRSCNNTLITDEKNVCNGHGACKENDTCLCIIGYKGQYCNETSSNTINPSINMTLFLSLLLGIGIPLVIFFVFVVICLILIIFCYCKRINKYKDLNLDLIIEENKMSSQKRLELKSEMFKIKIGDLIIERSIGTGGSGTKVYLAKYNDEKVAFKLFGSVQSEEEFKMFEREVEILSTLHHPNIISFFGATFDENRVGFVMEFCLNGNLKDFLNQNEISFIEKIRILKEISSALSFLHSKNIIHRDLKCENVLIDSQIRCKLIDFGLSKMLKEATINKTKTTRVGTSYYMAPEVTLGENYDEKCDSFSFAILSFSVLTNSFNNPYSQLNTSSSYQIEFTVAKDPNFRPKFPLNSSIPSQIKDFIKTMWNNDPKLRPSMNQIHLFLKNEVENSILKQKENPNPIILDNTNNFKDLQIENSNLKNVVLKKDIEISDLKKEIINLKMEISSLKEKL